MNDPNPVVVDPAPDPLPAPALRLAEAYPACFDWEHRVLPASLLDSKKFTVEPNPLQPVA
jgi:hypothetical protein